LSPLAIGGVAAPSFIPGHNYHGWFVGGGTEYSLDFFSVRGLFWRNEYRFSQYESADLPINLTATGAVAAAAGCGIGGAVTPCGEHIKPYTQTITSSLVWRFNWQ
jgi:outer membrane immunogenic protein